MSRSDPCTRQFNNAVISKCHEHTVSFALLNASTTRSLDFQHYSPVTRSLHRRKTVSFAEASERRSSQIGRRSHFGASGGKARAEALETSACSTSSDSRNIMEISKLYLSIRERTDSESHGIVSNSLVGRMDAAESPTSTYHLSQNFAGGKLAERTFGCLSNLPVIERIEP